MNEVFAEARLQVLADMDDEEMDSDELPATPLAQITPVRMAVGEMS